MGAMELEIQEIFDGIKDLRKALLSLDTQTNTPDETTALAAMNKAADDMEFETRKLQYESTRKDEKSGI